MRIEISRKLRDAKGKFALFSIALLSFLIIPSASRAGVLIGKVTSVHDDVVELNLGSEKGLQSGDSGKIFYAVTIGGKEKKIFIAKFKIIHLSEKSSMAQMEEKTADVKTGHLAEVTIEGGELEVTSDPSDARVFLDGKEVGRTPLVLSDVRSGRHQIRVVKEGHVPYEISEDMGRGRLKMVASLKRVVTEGELVVRTEPSGGMVYVNGRHVGTTFYEGRGLAAGKYAVRVTKEGYETWEKVETVEPGKKVEVLALLRIKPGDLTIIAEPEGASIYIGGRLVGISPHETKGLSPGSYRVRVTKEGYEPWEKEVVVEPGKKVEVLTELKEKRKEVTKPLVPAKPEPPAIKETKVTEVGISQKEKSRAPKICEAPVLKVGDHWTYRNARGMTFTNEVMEEKDDLYLIKIGGFRDLRGYDKKTLNIKYQFDSSGKRTEVAGAFRKMLNFPIFVGKKWKDETVEKISGKSIEAQFITEFITESVEEVATQGGKFTAYKIHITQTNLSSGRSGWVRYWYSPEVKSWIKREVEKSPYWSNVSWLNDAELISYDLK